jgi:hypothetical protein
VFGDRIISRGLWPTHLPDFIPCDFHLWGNLKDRIYTINPHAKKELKDNIRIEILKVSHEELLQLNSSLIGAVCVYGHRDSILNTCYNVGKFIVLFYGATLDLYGENLLVLGGELHRSYSEPASDI